MSNEPNNTTKSLTRSESMKRAWARRKSQSVTEVGWDENPTCLCGCGEPLVRHPNPERQRLFKPGHDAPAKVRRRRGAGRRGAGACDSGDCEDAEEQDRISQDEAGTLESILTGITSGTQSSRSCRIRAEDYSDPDEYPRATIPCTDLNPGATLPSWRTVLGVESGRWSPARVPGLARPWRRNWLRAARISC